MTLKRNLALVLAAALGVVACSKSKTDASTTTTTATNVAPPANDPGDAADATAATPAPGTAHSIPPALYAACTGKNVNDVCSVTFGSRAVEGVCWQPDTDGDANDKRLACRARGGLFGHGRHPLAPTLADPQGTTTPKP